MKIILEYKLNSGMLDNDKKEALFYHRLIESFKYAFAHRALLGDENQPEINYVLPVY